MNTKDNLHIAVCQAMELINQSVGVVSDEEGMRAKNILREALFNYQEPCAELPASLLSAQAVIDTFQSKVKALPRFNFLLNSSGGVKRWENSSGDWIEHYEVIKLLEALSTESPSTALQEHDKG